MGVLRRLTRTGTVSSTRAHLGTTRTGYSGPQPVRNLGLADLVESSMGLPAVPGGGGGTTTLRVS